MLNSELTLAPEAAPEIVEQQSLLAVVDVGTLDRLRAEHAVIESNGTAYHTKRASNFRNQHRFVASVGKAALEQHADKVLALKNVARSLTYGLCAQATTGINIDAEQDKGKRQALHNRVAPSAKMLEALAYSVAEHEHLSDQEFVDWYNVSGRFDGIWRAYQKATASSEEKAKAPDDAINVDDVIASLLGNHSAIEVPAIPGLAAGATSIFVAQGQGRNTRMVQLIASPAFIASLGDRAPGPLDNAPADLMLWRQTLMVAESIIPDTDSDLPINPVAEDDEVNATTVMLPSNAMILLRNGVLSIASARNRDTMVVEVSPLNGVGRLPSGPMRFLNNRSRHVTSPRLTAPTVCAGFIKDGAANIRTTDDGEKFTLAFKHQDKVRNSNLIFAPIKDMGSAWTYEVDEFDPRADVTLTHEVVEAMRNGIMPILAKSAKDYSVRISINEKGLSVANGKAAGKLHHGAGTGEAAVRVARSDFMRALVALLDLDLNGLTWAVDPRGLLRVEASTTYATYRVYIQTLREDADVRQRTGLRLVTSKAAAAQVIAA